MFVDLDLGQCEELGIYTTMVSILFTDKDHMLTSRCLICFNYDLGTFIDDSEMDTPQLFIVYVKLLL